MGIKYLLSQFSNWYMHVLCDINVSVACTCLCLFCTYRVDYTGTHCDGLGTGIWGCWKYTELNTNEAEDLSSPPRAFRISQSDKASHHLLWGWPVVVCNLWQTRRIWWHSSLPIQLVVQIWSHRTISLIQKIMLLLILQSTSNTSSIQFLFLCWHYRQFLEWKQCSVFIYIYLLKAMWDWALESHQLCMLFSQHCLHNQHPNYL